MLSDSAPSPEGSIPQVLGEGARPPASQPQPLKEEGEESPKEEQEEHQGVTEEEPLQEREGQEDLPKEDQEEDSREHLEEHSEEHPEENGYRKVVLSAVDVGLETLGHDGKQAILSLLENRYGFRENDIPDYPKSFVELLGELLGSSAQNLEREIMNNIRKVWAAPGDNLETVVESLKEHYPSTAPVEVTAEGPRSVTAEANTTGFRYKATYSKRRN
jgi:hypothetical protein